MKRLTLLNEYLAKYAAGDGWQLEVDNTKNINQVVVIPAYAEKEMLFSTLVSLAQNPPADLEHTLIVCVVNNKPNSPAPVKENNLDTIKLLNALIRKRSLKEINIDKKLDRLLTMLADSAIRIGYVDASTAGSEIPQKNGGVGMARKIGMDMALRLLSKIETTHGLIISLDADTPVARNYLSAIDDYFIDHSESAIVAYQHQFPENYDEQTAICCYEMFLRYWVLGLKYAQSPYAFHSIGSTIITTADAYLKVRGMNKREAGEDFYFLNKLAKIGKIGYIENTCVYPSARASSRVPFGTGARIQQYLSGERPEHLLYDPIIFVILADWLQLLQRSHLLSAKEIMMEAEKINPLLPSFLNSFDFTGVLHKISLNNKTEKILQRHLNDWFDGFKTLKLINFFTKRAYPAIDTLEALSRLFKMMKITSTNIDNIKNNSSLDEKVKVLQYLRSIT